MLLESASSARASTTSSSLPATVSPPRAGSQHPRYGLPPEGHSGLCYTKPVGQPGAEEAVGMPCMSIERMMDGTLTEVLGAGRTLEWNARDDFRANRRCACCT